MGGTVSIDGIPFRSALAPEIESLVSAKRSLGYRYEGTTLGLLRRLDGVCASAGRTERVVTKGLADAWAQAFPSEGGSQRRARMCLLRQLALHQRSRGMEAYVPKVAVSVERGAPYIPTLEETAAFFRVVDAYEDSRLPHMPSGYRVAFRLMRLCGMRISECAGMSLSDVDVPGGRLFVRRSKGDKDRLVYLSEGLAGMVGEHVRAIRSTLGAGVAWLFPGADPSRHINKRTYDQRFSEFWAKVPGASDRPTHPTPHCLRYRFVVDRLNTWARQGVDFRQMMPYLARYLGHETGAETFYYYRLADEALPVARDLGSPSSLAAIPEAVPYER